jgi:electron transfer flavoprotein beta subunit
LNVVVLVKQVPGTSAVGIDPERGTLKREGVPAKTNPYDLHALEAALTLKEHLGGRVTVVSMGPPQAESVIQEAYWMGADAGFLLTDRAFAGADTLATAFALSQVLRTLEYDLIIAGMQSTDGDTAQVGPGVAEFLGIPHVSYVSAFEEASDRSITVTADLGDRLLTQSVSLPCLVTVTQAVNQPRLPSLRKKKEVGGRPVLLKKAIDLPPAERTYYGLAGSATRVEKIFPPKREETREVWDGEPRELALRLARLLEEAIGP